MPEPTKEELLFGRIALHNKLLSKEQYQECLALRMRQSDGKYDFGSIAKAKNFLNEKQYRSVRKAQKTHIMKGGLTDEQADRVARGKAANEAAPAPAPAPAPAAAPAAAAPAPAAVEEFNFADEEPEETQAKAPERAAPEPTRVTQGDDEEVYPRSPRPADAKSKQTMIAMLKKARQLGASDVHLSCGGKPFMRLHGTITPYKGMPVLEDKLAKKLLSSVLGDKDWDKFMHLNDWDGGVDLGPLGRYRTNVMRQRRGVSGVLRVIKDEVPTLAELGMPEDLEKFTTFHQGMVLVTGATGSGKSSTLAALIDLINTNRKDHVITLEDPIEYIFESKGCNVTQRQVNLHTKSWGNALRAALREDPDVIMVGEMRDLDTVRLAITASETGHLVFGTLHTTNATRTIDRVLDVFPPKEQSQIRAMVSESLKGVISQQLVKRADGKGRVAAYELLFTTPAVSHLIRDRRTFQLFSVMQTGKKQGMKLMDDTLRELMEQGVITKEAARGAATNPRLFK
jgi:twitching motility protein PilT